MLYNVERVLYKCGTITMNTCSVMSIHGTPEARPLATVPKQSIAGCPYAGITLQHSAATKPNITSPNPTDR